MSRSEFTAPRPPDEPDRLAELSCYFVLDTPAEKPFDSLTRLAARVFETPIAFVSLLDRDRQWFKARYGLSIAETPRDVAICAYTIMSSDVMIVLDTTLDDRFAKNPFVTGPPFIRFYAGAPLRTRSGCNLGALCVADQQPRAEAPLALREDLSDLASLAMDELELRRKIVQLEDAKMDLVHARKECEEARIKLDKTQYRLCEAESPPPRVGGLGSWPILDRWF